MPQCPSSLLPFLLALLGYAIAGLNIWPSLHIALSNASVFVDFSTKCNSSTLRNTTLSLVDTETNSTLLTRSLPNGQSDGRIEFNCSCFLYAGTFRFHLRQNSVITDYHANGTDTRGTCTTSWWWSSELQVQWPTFHIAVDRAGNHSGSFQVGISTNEHFQPCSGVPSAALFLEVSYMEYNQIGRNSIDKVRTRTRHPIRPLRSQSINLPCAFPFTERDFIRVALRSPHTSQEVKSSGPLYLSRIFSYKLLVDNTNAYRSGCEGTMAVKMIAPPCAHISGKVLLYQDRSGSGGAAGPGAGTGGTPLVGFGSEEGSAPPLAFNWLTQGENETEFNCSMFYPGRNKYCFRFVFNYSRSPSPAQTCLVVYRSAESWGEWLPWSACSVSCGEGLRERVRECLLPSGGKSVQCTGMVKEQSLCSLEDCAALPLPSPSLPPSYVGLNSLGGNAVAVAGISLCLVVILATVVVTVWRKVCRTPQCSSVRQGSVHSPGGRKLSDEASICGHSLQRPSLADSQNPPAGVGIGLAQKDSSSLDGHPLSQALVAPVSQDTDRLSPTGPKMPPPIFGYRLAQQQLKEMKKKGLKEATKLYHVSSSPVQDTLETSGDLSPTNSPAATPTGLTSSGLTGSPVPLELMEDTDVNRFRTAAPFPEHRAMLQTSRATADRLSPRVELVLRPPHCSYGDGGSAKRRDRTADWVEMVARSGHGGFRGRGEDTLSDLYRKNPHFRRTFSFNDTQPQSSTYARQFRERSMTQVGSRTLPEGSCRTKGVREGPAFPPLPQYHFHGQTGSDWVKSRLHRNDQRPWEQTAIPCLNGELKHIGTNTDSISLAHGRASLNGTREREIRRSSVGGGGGENSGIGGPPGGPVRGGHLGLERAEQNWRCRGPSPIQRNILARKLKEAQACSASSGHRGRQRSSTFSVSSSGQNVGHSLPMSREYSSSGGSPYGLSEAEQRMLDLDLPSAYVEE